MQMRRDFTVASAVFSAGQTMVTAFENVFLGSETGWDCTSTGPDLPVAGVLAPNVLVFDDDVTAYFPEEYTFEVSRPDAITGATTGGQWSAVQLEVTGLGDHTLLTCDGADFRAYMAGWSLCLDAEKPSWFTVDVVVSATQLRLLKRNATGLTAAGKTFRLCPLLCPRQCHLNALGLLPVGQDVVVRHHQPRWARQPELNAPAPIRAAFAIGIAAAHAE